MTIAQSTKDTFSADFKINDQMDDLKVAVGTKVLLEAADIGADSYQWTVFCTPPECSYKLAGADQPQATLMVNDVGAFVIQLTTMRNKSQERSRLIVWAVTPNRSYCLPATGEPLGFTGRERWAGDLAQIIQDIDDGLLDENQKAAFDAAEGPSGDNPLITQSALPTLPVIPPPQLSADQEAAVDAADNPSVNNPFITQSALPTPPEDELNPDQKAAIGAAQAPSGGNPFITQSALPTLPVIPPPQLSADQEAAVDAADNPSGNNPFITQSALPAPPEDELNPDQKAAISAAQAPSGNNPFITQSALPTPPEDELNPDQKAAISAAQAPSGNNPFVTQSALPPLPVIPPPQLSADQEAAVDAADNPSANNPFITQSALPAPPEDELNPDQKAAISAAQAPSGGNPFITQSALPAPPVIPPPQLSADQEAAVDAAHHPSASNPFATHHDLEPLTWLVPRAAGRVVFQTDLNGNDSSGTAGNLEIVDQDAVNGRVTLTFPGYESARKNHYIVKALTFHDHPTSLNRIHAVELVRFQENGFVLHMSRFPGGQAALAPGCMIEVSEIMI
ncbi:MAG: hypothetical protein QNJ45_08615 [Ardenticatenaceae bacterium]|nr:hypothetical protein [Ardenticatenaceae bacterium]